MLTLILLAATVLAGPLERPADENATTIQPYWGHYVGDACLGVDKAVVGATVTLQNCSSPNIWWQVAGCTTFLPLDGTNLCARPGNDSPDSPGYIIVKNGDPLKLVECGGSWPEACAPSRDADGVWYVRGDMTGFHFHFKSYCMDNYGGVRKPGNRVVAWQCHALKDPDYGSEYWNQGWVFVH